MLGDGHFLNSDGDFRANDASPGHRTNGILKRRPKSSFTQKIGQGFAAWEYSPSGGSLEAKVMAPSSVTSLIAE